MEFISGTLKGLIPKPATAEQHLKDGAYGDDSYLSPFTWRYGSDEMRRLFSETQRRAVWRKAAPSLAEVEAGLGLISRGRPRASGEARARSG